jgi:hypothetical protein
MTIIPTSHRHARPAMGTLLAQLGGAYPRYLEQAPSAKGRFIQMGLVLVSTASLAMLSMSFALANALHVHWWLAVPLGLVWGFIILNLDRMLIQNMRLDGGLWRVVMMIVPRLVIAALLGIVIATPIVLQVFGSEIKAEMEEHNVAETASLGNAINDTPNAKNLAAVKQRIATDQGTLAGDVPNLTSPNVASARQNLATAQETLAQKRTVSQNLYAQMRCELDGERCSKGSGKVGPGPRYDALKRQYNIAVSDENSAQQAVATAQTALTQANNAATSSTENAVEEAKANARQELPGLIQQRDRLQALVDEASRRGTDLEAGDTGILAQIEALGRISSKSPSAKTAHWAVAALLFMIELLPVLVKLLSSIGPPTVYDRISELNDTSSLDAATLARNNERWEIEARSVTDREIREDMIKREKALAIKANAHVAERMEKVLDEALADWSREVSRTLMSEAPTVPIRITPHSGPATPIGRVPALPAPYSAAPVSGGPSIGSAAAHPSSTDGPVRTRFGLPPGSVLEPRL